MKGTRRVSLTSRFGLGILITGFLCIALVNASAQSPSSNWFEFYGGGAGDEIGFAAVENSNWTYLVAASTESFGLGGLADVWLIKMNLWGDTLWTNTYGGMQREGVSTMQPTPDGGCIMAGYTSTWAEGLSDLYIIKVDAGGTLENEVHHGGQSSDQAYDIQPTSDGGYIITGFTAHVPDTAGDTLLGDQVYLVKTDAVGNVDWSRSYGGQFQDYGRSVKETFDGGYIIAGNTYTDYLGHSEVYLIKTNSQGGLLWTKKFGFAWDDFGFAVFENADSGYTIVGETEFGGPALVDVYIIRTDVHGTELNWEHWGGNGADYVRDAKRTPDGHIVVAGYTYSWSAGTDPDIFLLKVDENGDTLWTQYYAQGIELREFGLGVLPTSDNGYLVVGRTDYNGIPEDDVYVLKVGGKVEPHVFRQWDLGLPVEHLLYAEDTLWVGFGGGLACAQTVVNVELLLDTLWHAAAGDLEITLSHAGVTDTIVYRAGGSGADFIGTRISDGATIPIGAGTAPFTSLYKPYKPLSAFSGLDPNGAWILQVTDVIAGNDGTLQAWGLNFNVDAAAGIEPQDATIPEQYVLHQNYPNPFNPETRIAFDLARPAFVTLHVYDVLGRKVATLVNEALPAGNHETEWRAGDYPSGVYFCQLRAGGQTTVRKMLRLK